MFILYDILLYIKRQTNVCVCICVFVRKIFRVEVRENGLIFFQNSSCSMSICIRRVRKCTVNVRSASWGAWQGHAPFSLQNYYRRTVEYFCIIPFASSRPSSKIIFKILSELSDRPKGRGRTTPLFRYKIITRQRLNIFAWFFLHDSFCIE